MLRIPPGIRHQPPTSAQASLIMVSGTPVLNGPLIQTIQSVQNLCDKDTSIWSIEIEQDKTRRENVCKLAT